MPDPDPSQPEPPQIGVSPEAFSRAHTDLAGWVRRELQDRCGHRQTAEDLSQRTWQGVWEAVKSGRYDAKRAGLSTFVYAVSLNVYRAWARRQGTAADHRLEVGLAEQRRQEGRDTADGLAVDESLARAELIDTVRGVLREGSGIGEEHRAVLRLIAQGVTDRGLAQTLGVSPSTAHARKKEALTALREHLTRSIQPATERREVKGQSP